MADIAALLQVEITDKKAVASARAIATAIGRISTSTNRAFKSLDSFEMKLKSSQVTLRRYATGVQQANGALIRLRGNTKETAAGTTAVLKGLQRQSQTIRKAIEADAKALKGVGAAARREAAIINKKQPGRRPPSRLPGRGGGGGTLLGAGAGALLSGGGLARFAGGAGLVIAAKEILQSADAFQTLQNRLRTVTEGQRELSTVTKELFAISKETRTSIDLSVSTYSRLALSSDTLGLSQKKLLDFTKTLNQSVLISGGGAASSAAGLLQLSQGLASGVLRGDELNSVLEQIPFVAKVIAKELGVGIGELRKLGAAGLISTEIIIAAFTNQAESIDDLAKKRIPTLSEAFIVFSDQATKSIGEVDQSLGATSALARGIINTSGFLADAITVLQGSPGLLDTIDTASIAELEAMIVLQQNLVESLKGAEVPGFLGLVADFDALFLNLDGAEKRLKKIQDRLEVKINLPERPEAKPDFEKLQETRERQRAAKRAALAKVEAVKEKKRLAGVALDTQKAIDNTIFKINQIQLSSTAEGKILAEVQATLRAADTPAVRKPTDSIDEQIAQLTQLSKVLATLEAQDKKRTADAKTAATASKKVQRDFESAADRIIAKTQRAAVAEKEDLEEINQLRALGLLSLEQAAIAADKTAKAFAQIKLAEKLNDLSGFGKGIERASQEIGELPDALERLGGAFADTLTDTLTRPFEEGETAVGRLKESLQSLFAEASREVTKQLIVQPLLAGITNTLNPAEGEGPGALSGLAGGALGGFFGSGGGEDGAAQEANTEGLMGVQSIVAATAATALTGSGENAAQMLLATATQSAVLSAAGAAESVALSSSVALAATTETTAIVSAIAANTTAIVAAVSASGAGSAAGEGAGDAAGFLAGLFSGGVPAAKDGAVIPKSADPNGILAVLHPNEGVFPLQGDGSLKLARQGGKLVASLPGGRGVPISQDFTEIFKTLPRFERGGVTGRSSGSSGASSSGTRGGSGGDLNISVVLQMSEGSGGQMDRRGARKAGFQVATEAAKLLRLATSRNGS